MPDTMPDGRPWPKISIVTPSYNQGQFIEETIRSVLLQGYPNLEYIIIDGGSTDNSVDIIRKYEKWIGYWVNETDRGQAHALNKGFQKATGHIIGWLNSDDLYLPDTYARVAKLMWDGKRIVRPVVYGSQIIFDESIDMVIRKHVAQPADFDRLLAVWDGGGLLIPQGTLFIATELTKIHQINESLHYILDYDLWLRLSREVPFHCVTEEIFGAFRLHDKSKTISGGGWLFDKEITRIGPKYWGKGCLSARECRKKFWYQYMARRNLIWPASSFLRRNKNKLVSKVISVLGQYRYDKIKKPFGLRKGD